MPESFNSKEYSKTWMLFESGEAVVVDLTMYPPPPDKHRPIDAYVVTERDGDLTGSACRASEAVYDVARQYRRAVEPVIVGYDLKGLSGGEPVAGESGGLAFALALAKRLLGQDPGPVAATGELETSPEGGPIGPVKGIAAKLEAAGRVVPENGWIFYPQDNDDDIPDRLRKSLTDKGIKLRPVSSVAGAMEDLFALGEPSREKKPQTWKAGRPLRTLLLFVLLVSVALAGGLWVQNRQPTSIDVSNDKVRTARLHAPEPVTQKENDRGGKGSAPDQKTQHRTARASHLKAHLAGDGRLTNDLAQRLNRRLNTLFKNGIPSYSGETDLFGQLKILWITEDPVGDKGDLKSSITVALKRLTLKNGRGERSFSLLEVTVEGKGTADELLSKAAEALSAKIAGVLAPQKRAKPIDKKDTYKDAGFE